ncbi:MAG: hypothetical protein GEU28_12410 [Dehalococcoidia bacterium]|nr:hypothetical protein [Dehalococcoidia bacterium]
MVEQTPESLERPDRSPTDLAHAVAKAGFSAIPVVGGAAAELFQYIVGPPIERRRDKWMEDIAAVVSELQAKAEGVTPESLANDESFVTVIANASQIALRTHLEEKLSALRNAVQNSALPEAPDDSTMAVFLNLIDTLTPAHMKLLKVLDDPRGWFSRNSLQWPNVKSGGLSTIVEAALPELKGRTEFSNLLARDMDSGGLTSTSSLSGIMSAQGLEARRTTDLGRQFLLFIEKQV